MFGPLRAALSTDPFVKQAREDQKKADYPNCVQGLMHCRAFCGSECPATSLPTARFVNARAATLRARATCEHKHIVPKFATLFEMLGPRGERCLDCDLVRDGPGDEWRERDD